jgi:cytochrome c peroxidase
MHDGSVETLRDVVRQHAPAARLRNPSPARQPALSGRDIDDLVAFLHTLTDANAERRPLPAVEAACVAGG